MSGGFDDGLISDIGPDIRPQRPDIVVTSTDDYINKVTHHNTLYVNSEEFRQKYPRLWNLLGRGRPNKFWRA